MLLDICIEPRPTGPGVLVSLPSRITRTFIKLSLALLVTKIFADHHNATLATNDFALIADLLHAWINLHAISPL
jgi:hypothetical protein